MNHYQITFNVADQIQQEILIALLSVAGFESFEQTDTSLKAFIKENEIDEAFLVDLSSTKNITYSKELIKEQNWNQSWESSFDPVVINDFVAIRADFHEPVKNVKHEIIITPKMSFGTGHHATTYLMISSMEELDFVDKTVLDFGTGTGVLAILAEKLGSKKVDGIDYDEWSIDNAAENIKQNNCQHIELTKSDTISTEGPYGIILANINRNVIMENFENFAIKLEIGGILLLSGLLNTDSEAVSLEAGLNGFISLGGVSKGNWCCLKYTH